MKITVTGQFNEGEVLFIWEFYFPKLVHSLIEFFFFVFFLDQTIPKVIYLYYHILPPSPFPMYFRVDLSNISS